MAKTRDELLTTPKGQIVGKHQLYALLVDDAGVAILDAAGNEQVIEIKAGADGKIQTSSTVVGSLAKEPFSGSVNKEHTFTQPMNGFSISNDGLSSLTFTIGTDTYTVLAGEVLSLLFSPFNVVTVTTTVAYRAWGLV